jgi:hypothetical protein
VSTCAPESIRLVRRPEAERIETPAVVEEHTDS